MKRNVGMGQLVRPTKVGVNALAFVALAIVELVGCPKAAELVLMQGQALICKVTVSALMKAEEVEYNEENFGFFDSGFSF